MKERMNGRIPMGAVPIKTALLHESARGLTAGREQDGQLRARFLTHVTLILGEETWGRGNQRGRTTKSRKNALLNRLHASRGW